MISCWLFDSVGKNKEKRYYIIWVAAECMGFAGIIRVGGLSLYKRGGWRCDIYRGVS